MGLFRRKAEVATPADHEPAPTPRPAGATAGAPGRCPQCHGLGYLDHVDLARRSQRSHCRSCGHEWDTVFEDDDTDVFDPGDLVIDVRDHHDARHRGPS